MTDSNDKRAWRDPGMLDALAPVVALVVMLAASVYLYGADSSYGANQIALLIAAGIAVLVGLELAMFKFLETRGILEVNWDAIGGATQNATSSAATAASGQPPGWLMSLLSALPVSAGFTGGFLVGFRQG